MGTTQARLERAALLVAELHRLTVVAGMGRSADRTWRRADAVGRDVGILGRELEQAIKDAVQADLVVRRADDMNLIQLTAKGRAVGA